MELRFVNVSRSDGTRHHGTLRLVKDDSGRVRTRVVLDPHPNQGQQPASERSDCEFQQFVPCPSPVAYTIRSPDLWRGSFLQAMIAALFPKAIGYARLAECDIALNCSQHTWTPVVAIHDAMALVHVGSASNDDTLLLEGKKRYVFAISELRQALSRKTLTVPVEAILVVSMGLMLTEVRSPDSPRHGVMVILHARDNFGYDGSCVFVYHADLSQDVLSHYAWFTRNHLVSPCGWHISICVCLLL